MRPKNPTNVSSQGRESAPSKTLDSASKDTVSETLLDGASELGNSEMKALLKRGSETRDALLQFLVARLTQMQSLQIKEAALLKRRDEWFLKVHRGSDFLPQPNRWHESAGLYREASLALARGDNLRCWQLIRKGLTSESVAQKEAPLSLRLHLMTPPSAPAQPRHGLASSFDTQRATDLAESILNRSYHVDEASTRRKALHDWFASEEEEEDPNAS